MSRRQLRREIVRLLSHPELMVILRKLQEIPAKELLNPLFSCLCHPEEMVRWHTVSAFGYVVPTIAGENLEDARIVMRRFLWMLNDESGGIGWGVPEAMGEVMSQHETLADEYVHMLVSYSIDDGPGLFQYGNFLEMPTIQHGLLWGLCRVAEKHADLLLERGIEANLGCYFSSPDSQVRGLVCRLCGRLALTSFQSMLTAAASDHQYVRLYQSGDFINCSVSELAQQALMRLQMVS